MARSYNQLSGRDSRHRFVNRRGLESQRAAQGETPMMRSLAPDQTYSLADIFGSLHYPIPDAHDYFVATRPSSIELQPSDYRALEVRAPFFVDHGWAFGLDPDIVPFVWDRAAGGQPRFSEA